MFGVVVDEHVVWHGQHVTIHVDCSGHHHLLWTQPSGLFQIFNFSWKITASRLDFYLEPPHVSRVSCIFQTVLIALQEELQEESERCVDKTGKKERNTISFIWTAAQNGREPSTQAQFENQRKPGSVKTLQDAHLHQEEFYQRQSK